MRQNPDFMGAEIRGIKTQRSGRESYGDNAIGYVQVKREASICTVKAKVTPEHSVQKRAYNVTLICNEVEEQVLSVSCEDCAASQGGCKHAVALLTWIHRRSEEPSVTSVTCYWKSSYLSAVGKSLKFVIAKDLCKNDTEPLPASDGSFLKAAFLKCKQEGFYDTVLSKHFKGRTNVQMLSMHHLISSFFQAQAFSSTAEDFLNYCSSQMSDSVCKLAQIQTVEQFKSTLWHELRYGRITDSKAHEAAHCHTLEGSLVEMILGASSLKDSNAMMRGRKLEKDVRGEIEKLKNVKINPCGLVTLPEHPIMGASPDGICNDYVIEIKCPMTEKAVTRYIKNGQVMDKYQSQIQMQMFFCKKKEGLFCLADVNFEHSKKISIVTLEYDEQYCLNILKKCTNFWKSAIFPVLKNSFN